MADAVDAEPDEEEAVRTVDDVRLEEVVKFV
jgi:hypothetical protein